MSIAHVTFIRLFFVVLLHSCIIFLTFFRVLIVASTLKSFQLKTTVLANLTVKTNCFFFRSRGKGFPVGFVLDCAPVIPVFPHLHCSRAPWYAMHYYLFTLKKVSGPTAFHFGVSMIVLMFRFPFAVCDSLIQSSFFCCFLCVTGLGKLFKLQWLSLSGNNLATLDTGVLEKLSDLKYLSVENNCITHLRGLQVWMRSWKYLVTFLSYEGGKCHKLCLLK